MISLWHIGCIFSGIFSYIFFNIQIKKAHSTTFTCLSSYICANVLFFLVFFIQKWATTGSFHNASSHLGKIFCTDILWSIIGSLILLLMSIIFAHLLENYPVSNVTMVLQLGVPISSFGYYLVGNIASPSQFTGIIIITLGAIISGFKQFEFPNIFKPLLSIPLTLYALGILRSIISSMGKIVVFIVSQKTTQTLDFHHLINNFDDFSPVSNVFEVALDFVVGRSPFLIFTFILYILYLEQFSFKNIIKKTKQDAYSIITAGLLISIYTGLYYYVFQTIEHKSVLSALNKFKIPFTVIIASFVLKEKINFPKKVATFLIVAGGLLAAL